MKTRIFLVAMALMVFASLSFGQGFCRQMYNDSYPLTATCGGTDYLPDGTPVYIFWDNDSNGPDADDPLASAIPAPCVVNYDHFLLNGEEMGIGAGLFIANEIGQDFCSAGCMPTPSRFYLRVYCAGPGSPIHYETDVATFTLGPDVYQWNVWNCTPCQGGCTPTPEATIQVSCAPNDPNCAQSVCLQLCSSFQTVVRICGPATTPLDPAHAPVVSYHPGCYEPCIDPNCPPAGAEVAGPFPDPAAHCWVYIVTGAGDGCFCFTFQYFLAAGIDANSFTAVPGDNEVTVNWSTLSETGVANFQVTRNGQVVGSVNAENNPTGATYHYTDATAHNGTNYTYGLKIVNADGSTTETDLSVSATPSFGAAVITEYALHQNFPNPFNPTTEIAFDVLNSNPVTLKIYNAAGQEVATLLNGATKEKGRYVVNFDATSLTSGLYFYTVKMGSEFSATKKMLLVK